MFISTTGTITVPDSSGIANLTGTVTHASGSKRVAGASSPVFTTELKPGDYILAGTIVRQVEGTNTDAVLYVSRAYTTSAGPITAKRITPEYGFPTKITIKAIGGAITISTPTDDNVSLASGSSLVLEDVKGVPPVVIVTGGNLTEVSY